MMFRTDPTKAPARGAVHYLFTIRFQIGPKFRRGLIHFLLIRPQQIFTYITILYQSCHVKIVVTVTLLKFQRKHAEMSMEFESRWKIVKEIVPPYF